MSGTFLKVDDAQVRAIREQLRSYQGAEMEKRLRKATLAGARSLVAPLRSATPRAKGRVPTSHPRDLSRSIRVRQMKSGGHGRNRKFIGYRVGPGGKLGFHRYWVIAGTKPHFITGKVGSPLGLPFGPRAYVMHPGARANPYVARVEAAQRDRVMRVMARSIARQKAKAGF